MSRTFWVLPRLTPFIWKTKSLLVNLVIEIFTNINIKNCFLRVDLAAKITITPGKLKSTNYIATCKNSKKTPIKV